MTDPPTSAPAAAAGGAAAVALPEGVAGLLGEHLARQRWYAGSATPAGGDLLVVDSRRLASTADGTHLHWAIIEVGGVRYQLLIGERPGDEPAGFLHGTTAFIGSAGRHYFYDATVDPELMLALFEMVTGSPAGRMRPVSAEQSNTSLVFDDRVIVKIFRRLLEGANPDIEVTTALGSVGFANVAEPAGTWRADGVDLAFAQQFLAGGSEGWALALTSLRDLYNSASDDPAEAGGDFSAEAFRLGRMTAELHVALSRAFPLEPDGLEASWTAFVDQLEDRLLAAVEDAGDGGKRAVAVAGLMSRLRRVGHKGPALRVHGDYHLGQVMRTDGGWYVLDFEGEPARALEERSRPSSAMKDVTGMLRSLDYAAQFALGERTSSDRDQDRARTDAWERHNRAAFLDGYHHGEHVGALLAATEADRELVLAAFELDKALYELRYEQAYRPDWVDIPRAAIGRILDRAE